MFYFCMFPQSEESHTFFFPQSLLLQVKSPSKINPKMNWREASTWNKSTHNSSAPGGLLCAEEAGLTQMSQSAIYQPIALTDGPLASANSKPLVSHTSTQADALIWQRALFYLRSIVTSNLASEQFFHPLSCHLDNHLLLQNTTLTLCSVLESNIQVFELNLNFWIQVKKQSNQHYFTLFNTRFKEIIK